MTETGPVKRATLTASAAARARVEAEGKTQQQIADRLQVSQKAVSNVLARLSTNGPGAETPKPALPSLPEEAEPGRGRPVKASLANHLKKPRQPKPAPKVKAKAKAKKPVQPPKPSLAKLKYEARHKRQWHQRLLLAALRQRYPAAFPPFGESVKPLKIGIYQDILALRGEIEGAFASRDRIRGFLQFYTSRWRYHQAILDGHPRVDLAGNAVAQITERERARAAEQLKRRVQPAETAAETANVKNIGHKAVVTEAAAAV